MPLRSPRYCWTPATRSIILGRAAVDLRTWGDAELNVALAYARPGTRRAFALNTDDRHAAQGPTDVAGPDPDATKPVAPRRTGTCSGRSADAVGLHREVAAGDLRCGGGRGTRRVT